MSPRRIKRQRAKGWSKPPGAVYVGRGSRYGNPYRVEYSLRGTWSVYHQGEPIHPAFRYDDAVAYSIERYRQWINEPEQADLRAKVRAELAGRDLMCWCREGDPCHGDVLLKIANGGAA